MIESAALAARIQASELFPGYSIPEGPSLWAEAMNWACDAYNRAVDSTGSAPPTTLDVSLAGHSMPGLLTVSSLPTV